MCYGREKDMNSFYLAGVGQVGDGMELLPEEAKHAAQVLRLRPGEEIYAVDEGGQRFSAVVERIDRDGCTVRLLEALSSNEAPLRITLYQGLPKGDKMELIVQKLTELGATAIVPVKMERCVVKLDAKDGLKRSQRLQRIAREAAKQCKRARCLQVFPPQTWKELEGQLAAHDLLLVPWEEAGGLGMAEMYKQRAQVRDLGIVIGPEGGMSAEEVTALEELGAQAIHLGPRILRTETAALAACTMAMLLWGDMG